MGRRGHESEFCAGRERVKLARLSLVALACLFLANCASSDQFARQVDPRYGVASSPRVIEEGQTVPKGGGTYRVGKPYQVAGRMYVPEHDPAYRAEGMASWYGSDFHGRLTANGEVYDKDAISAAHPTLPMPSYARVTNLANGRSVVVRINDRGPFVAHRIVDLSYAAATRLDLVRTGTAFVELRTVGPAAAGSGVTPTPEPPTRAAPAPEVEPPSQSTPVALYIQIGAFADPANAQRVLDRLQSNGFRHVFSQANSATGRLLRRVRIGPIATVEEFDQLAARLTTLGYPEAQLASD